MSKERFEVFGNIIKDNEQMPSLLDNYQATVRLNEFTERITELEEQLENAIVPKFEEGQEVWFVHDTKRKVFSGRVEGFQITQYPYLTYKYVLIEYCDEYVVGDFFKEEYVFATKEEAEAKLKEL